MISLLLYGCTSNTTVIQPTTTVTKIVTPTSTVSTTPSLSFSTTPLPTNVLSSVTVNILAEVNMNITVLCFFLPTDDQYHTETYALDTLAQYQKYTNDLTVEIIDPTQNPVEAIEYDITDSSLYESVVFKTDKGTILVTPTEIVDPNTGEVYVENSFTNAILQVTGQQEKKVYFVIGDGEASPSDILSDLSSSLNADLFQVETINLQVATSIPSDCAVLVIAGPTTAMTSNEPQIIANYFASGGSEF